MTSGAVGGDTEEEHAAVIEYDGGARQSVTHAAASQLANCPALRRVADALRAHAG
jgi:hypothetical protein